MTKRLTAGLAALLLGALAAMPQARAFTIQSLDTNSDGSAKFADPDQKTQFQSPQPFTSGGATQSNSFNFEGSNFSFSVTGGQPQPGFRSPYYFRQGFMNSGQIAPGANINDNR
jgi:hypothetical protein